MFPEKLLHKKKTQSKILVNRPKYVIFQASYCFPNFRTKDVQGSLNMGPDTTTIPLSWLVPGIIILEFLIFKHLYCASTCAIEAEALAFPSLGVQGDTEYAYKWAASRADWEQQRMGSFCSQSWKSLWSSDPFPSSLTSDDVNNIITKQKGFLSELETLDFCFHVRNTIAWNLRCVSC